MAALLIGVILGYVALELARRNGDFLIGRRASPKIEAGIRQTILGERGVTGITELLVTFLGPRQLRVLARVDIDDRLDGAGVKSLFGRIEEALIRSSEFIGRVESGPGRPTRSRIRWDTQDLLTWSTADTPRSDRARPRVLDLGAPVPGR